MNICLFCDFSSDWDGLKKHLMQHMQLPYMCSVCDRNVSRDEKIACEVHVEPPVFDSDELDFTMYWVWSFIEYSKSDLMKYAKKPMYCCVVCEKVKKVGINNCMDNSQFDAKFDLTAIRDHLKSHLRYFRYYCNDCKFIAPRATLRKHVKNVHNHEDVERVIRHSTPLRKLEHLIEIVKGNFLALRKQYLQENQTENNGKNAVVALENGQCGNQNCDNLEPHTYSMEQVNDESNGSVNENRSVEFMIKNCDLKPCTVSVCRLSDEEIAKFKVDLSRCINAENIEDNIDFDLVVNEKIEEVAMDIPDAIVDENVEFDSNQTFICVFCNDKELKSYQVAYKHYQVHLDYYPYKCSICDEVNLSLNCLFQHFKDQHENEKKATFQHCENDVISKWIKSFLTQQVKNSGPTTIKSSCPVCEALHKDILSLPLYSSNSKALVTHVLKHLCYEPFVCIECMKQEKIVTFNLIAHQKTYYHVLKFHKEKASTDLTLIMKKLRRIGRLERFIEQYLAVKEIKYKDDVHRRIPNFIVANYEKKMNEKKDRLAINLEKPTSVKCSNSEIIPPKKQIPHCAINKLISNKPIPNPTSKESNLTEKLMIENPPLIISVSPCDEQVSENPYLCRYFCVFCEAKTYFTSKLDACSHLAEHLNYFPVVCLLCSNKFADLKSLMAHHSEVHAATTSPWGDDPSASLLYVVNEDEDTEKWIEDFLDFQNSGSSWNLFSASFQHNCFVCKRLLNEFPTMFTHFLTDTSLQQHVHRHLNYYPYECIICKNENRVTRFALIDSLASDHLAKHGISYCVESASTFFLKTLTIKSLEMLISEAVVKISLPETVVENKLSLKESIVFFMVHPKFICQ
ncbi:hypothetical protein B4U80_13640 [Leptotrombidium deliense]|uniref:C2H2-type domain-containing protein n=1 Tax=Leptotrombidium deliense TaxID=299467 RepID=A0A443SQD4_9ACAR|nr:hypothetical protein B4U80_13640 [Leptotrombidium deliense]